MTEELPYILINERFDERSIDFRNTLFNLKGETITEDNIYYITRIYNASKLLDIRNIILKLLYDFDFPELKVFFDEAYKKERYLDLKIYALRGLSNFITETEVAALLVKFNYTLAKRLERVPYNYQEYELLRGKNALPFLIDKFDYSCFKETLKQVNDQYESMPDAFKGHFTTNEKGEVVLLRKTKQVKKMMNNFWKIERKKTAKKNT
jgi:hypothetical protein